MYACVQAWDERSARQCAQELVGVGFDGVAIGGLVPRIRDCDNVFAIIAAVKREINDLPLHVFGIGNPKIVSRLFNLGVDSVDSSAYVQIAVEGRTWEGYDQSIQEPATTDRLLLALRNLAVMSTTQIPLSVLDSWISTYRTIS